MKFQYFPQRFFEEVANSVHQSRRPHCAASEPAPGTIPVTVDVRIVGYNHRSEIHRWVQELIELGGIRVPDHTQCEQRRLPFVDASS